MDVVEEYFKTYFYITKKGLDLHSLHCSDGTWPFDDLGDLRARLAFHVRQQLIIKVLQHGFPGHTTETRSLPAERRLGFGRRVSPSRGAMATAATR